MVWIIGFLILVAIVFLAGVAKGGTAEGGAQVIWLVKNLLWIVPAVFIILLFLFAVFG